MSKKKAAKNNNRKITTGIIIVLVILIPLGYWVINSNPQITKSLTGESSKKKTKRQQAIEYDDYAQEMLEPIIVEMKKPVSPYKFIKRSLDEVESYTWKALDLDSTLTSAWVRLGYITSGIHGQQALKRYESYINQNKPEKAAEEEKNTLLYFAQADVYFDKALEYGHADSAQIYYYIAEAYTIQYMYDLAALELQKAMEYDPTNRKYEARLIDSYLYSGHFQLALEQNEQYRQKYPESDLPYRNLGGYFTFKGDTLKAIPYYETAIEKGTDPNVGKFLHKYYITRGDTAKADYYLQKVYEANLHYDPEKY